MFQQCSLRYIKSWQLCSTKSPDPNHPTQVWRIQEAPLADAMKRAHAGSSKEWKAFSPIQDALFEALVATHLAILI
jgi:hypothetical protein